MDIAHAGLTQQPFHTHGTPLIFAHYRSEQAAHSFLKMVLTSDRGIGLLHGPESSGKKTIIRQFVHGLAADLAVAVVDGARLNTPDLLDAIHSQFGHEIGSNSADVSLNELEEFIAQQARAGQAPLLVVENFDKMYPSALRVLCKLALLKLQGRFSLRMILVSQRPSYNIIHAPAMSAIAARTLSSFELGPMTPRESSRYLYAKLRAGGCVSPDNVLPVDICDELHRASGGWPGILDGLVMRAIERAGNWPIRREHVFPPAAEITPVSLPDFAIVNESSEPEVQKLYLTLNKKTLQEFELKDSRVLIGRSELCDIFINSRFVSKHHALLIRTDDAMHLVDLNSTNGTFVNSQRVQSKALLHDDIISLGNHGIKLISPAYRTRPVIEEIDLADTVQMKTLEDMRQLKARAIEEIVPIKKREI